MPLVFVHGVANRRGPDFDRGAATRDALFRRFLLASRSREDGDDVTISNPYWGDLGGVLRWDGASVPLSDFEALGARDETIDELAIDASMGASPDADQADRILLEAARRSLVEAIDLLWTASAITVGDSGDGDTASIAMQLAGLAVPAHAYAAAHPHPEWLDQITNDTELLNRLEAELRVEVDSAGGPSAEAPESDAGEWEGLGVDSAWQVLRAGAARLTGAVVGAVGRQGSEQLRLALLPSLSRFLGDVFVYLHEQSGAAGPIRERVGGAIRDAAARATDADPLVVVAHSMGGIITYDLLSDELSDVNVPLLVTAGTQVGFFEELKLFRRSDKAIPGDDPTRKVSHPSNVGRWINIFDYSDFLGFNVGSIIEGVEDFAYPTGSLLKAHSQYFLQPSFHERLAARVG